MIIIFFKLNKTIVNCKKCPRLANFVKKISLKKRKQNINEEYWGKPVTGFGDLNAKIMIIGLAPAAHGGTRTGRAFTGDKSGDFLFKSLYSAKISNQNFSKKINDGLKLNSTYITNILKCVPPGDKPKNNELTRCSNYFIQEMEYLKNLIINDSKKINERYIGTTISCIFEVTIAPKVPSNIRLILLSKKKLISTHIYQLFLLSSHKISCQWLKTAIF